ncbi:MAG: Fic family protein [Actinobacteria bacterium]|nr:Fic family protein [Actinomycetota bacterium]
MVADRDVFRDSNGAASSLDPEEAKPQLPIPPVTQEAHIWTPKGQDFYSRAEIRRQTGQYRSCIPTKIADWSPTSSSELSADIEDATRALVEFDQHAAHSLGPDTSAIGPMSAILLRTESASSSQIENLTVRARQLALAEIGAGDSLNSQEVVGNVRAMEAAIALSDEISFGSILAMHHSLLTHQRGMEGHAGILREELVWIGKGEAGPRQADFVAPQPQLVRPALDDLMSFANRTDIPVLLQIAVAHAQFETIHPFVDGNGRTGRALVQALLRSTGIAKYTTVPLSAGLLTDTERYFAALTAFRAGDAEPICRTFAQAARFAAASGRELIDQLRAELEVARMLLLGVNRHAAAWRLLPRLIGQPVVNSAYVQQALGVGTVTANRALETLSERGVLVERTGKRRGRIWQHTGMLNVLDEYAEGIRRAT